MQPTNSAPGHMNPVAGGGVTSFVGGIEVDGFEVGAPLNVGKLLGWAVASRQ